MSEPQKAYEEAAHSHAHISPMLGIPGEPDSRQQQPSILQMAM